MQYLRGFQVFLTHFWTPQHPTPHLFASGVDSINKSAKDKHKSYIIRLASSKRLVKIVFILIFLVFRTRIEIFQRFRQLLVFPARKFELTKTSRESLLSAYDLMSGRNRERPSIPRAVVSCGDLSLPVS